MKWLARGGTWQAWMKDYVSSFYMTTYWSVAGYWWAWTQKVMCMQVFTGKQLPCTAEKVWLTCSWAAWSAMVLVSCRNWAFAMLPRAAKHLERTKQLVNNWVLLPTFGPRKENKNLGSRPSSVSSRGGVALLQEKDFAKTHVQMWPLALLHGRSHGQDQCSCFTSPGFRDALSLSMPVSSLKPCYTLLWVAISKNLCKKVMSSCPQF